MNITDTAKVLAKIQAFNNRTFDKPAVMAWHEVLEDLDLDDSLTAVSTYFRESKEWIMPSDIRAGVKAIRNARVAAIRQDVRLREEDEHLDDVKMWNQCKAHLVNLIASGQVTADQYHAYHAGTFQITSMPKALTK